MLEWLIIGGGIHGTYFSHILTSHAKVPRDRIRVLDPHSEPLSCWRTRAANTGMAYLRSPDVHNIDLDPMSMFHFARLSEEASRAKFSGISRNQPALEFFQRHVDWVVSQHDLASLRLVGQADRLSFYPGGLRVETSDGSLEARHVLLAIGPNAPSWPDWSLELQEQGAPVHHVFDLNFVREALPTWTHAIVVGGGITAAQTALALTRQAPETVTFLPRHPIREHSFDSDPCWFSSCLSAYGREANLERRRATIQKARYRGSIPPEILHEIREAVTLGQLRLHTAEVTSASYTSEGQISLLCTDGSTLQTDRLILATGFCQGRPGGAWLTQTIASLELACSSCGYPIIDRHLHWHEHLQVSGPLAELEIGPAARNIMGARLAGERILAVAQS